VSQHHLEIKTRYIDAGDARSLIEKGTIAGLVTTAKISKPAKKLLDEAGIAWAENVSKEHFLEDFSLEEGEC
jgi:hypothetical protein